MDKSSSFSSSTAARQKVVLLLGPRRSGKTRFISIASREKYLPCSRFYKPTLSTPNRKVVRINAENSVILFEPQTVAPKISRSYHLKMADAVIAFAPEGKTISTDTIDHIASKMKIGATIGIVDNDSGGIHCTADAISLIAALIDEDAELSKSMNVETNDDAEAEDAEGVEEEEETETTAVATKDATPPPTPPDSAPLSDEELKKSTTAVKEQQDGVSGRKNEKEDGECISLSALIDSLNSGFSDSSSSCSDISD